MKGPITTHVLDTARGLPVQGLAVTLDIKDRDRWVFLSQGKTDADGRLVDLLPEDHELHLGTYRLTFAVGGWQESFFPEVTVTFKVTDPERHHHIPLLLSSFGYSTYRGS